MRDLRDKAIDHTGCDESRLAGAIIQSDFDDRFDPLRISLLAAEFIKQVESNASVRQFTKNRVTSEELHCVRRSGIEGTVFHSAQSEIRYPSSKKEEDSNFLRSLDHLVIDNHPEVYIRQYHGSGTWRQDYVMRAF